MARVRQLMLGVASGSFLYSGMVPALGLGEITLHSALNQPLEAEIELLQVGDLGAGDMRIGLASAEVFGRAGVERLFFLNDLRFTPLLRGSRSVIRVASNRPVREPYLNFIVEVARPGGQILREYTVLLDPPGSSAYMPVAAPDVAARPPQRSIAPAAPVRYTVPPSAELGYRQQVVPGDNLWAIAARLRQQGSTLSQQALMDGIQALNPTAFAGGDRNRLMAGVDLLLPDAARPAADAGRSTEVAAAPVAAQDGPPGQDESVQQLLERQRQLDLELASQAAENLQLQQGLAQLQLQMQQMQEQLALKDAQLAELLAQGAPQAVVVPAAPEVTPAQQAPVAAERGWFATLLVGGLVLLLLFGAVLWAVRRRSKVEARQAQPQVQRPQPAVPPVLAAVSEPAVEPAPAPAPVPTPQQRSVAPSDPLAAANVYIAYGRFSAARNELRSALQQTPQRVELRFRLLEVLAELGDAAGFAREEAVLRADGFESARLDQLKARFPVLQQTLPVGGEEPFTEPQPATGALVESDFQLNLDDLSLDVDLELASPFQASARGKDRAPEDLDASFTSNLQELPEVLELNDDGGEVSAFGEMEMVMANEDELLDEDFLDAFAGDADATAGLQGDLDRLAGNPEHMAKLDQALVCIERGELASACDILNEVIDRGDEQQKQAARQLLAEIA